MSSRARLKKHKYLWGYLSWLYEAKCRRVWSSLLDLANTEASQISRRDALIKGIGAKKNQKDLVLNYRPNDAERVDWSRQRPDG